MTTSTNGLDDILHQGYRYAFSLTHDDEMAQEILQEACLKISRRGGPWQIPYLVTTIRNTYFDSLRRSRKIEFEPLDDLDFMGDIEITLTSFDPQLETALGQLRADARELLYLSVVEGYSANELAELTQRPRSTILSILYRTKQKLRIFLAQDIPE